MQLQLIIGLIICYIFRKWILKLLSITFRIMEKAMPLLLIGLAIFYSKNFFGYWRSHPSLVILTLLILGMYLVVRGVKRLPGRRLTKAGIRQVDQMSGEEFEIYLEHLFTKKGYQVERTSYAGDYGVDLVVKDRSHTYAVQAKRYRGKVGVRAIQEVVAGMSYYDCAEAMVVTNSQFTPQAVQLARKNRVILWDRPELIRQMHSLHKKRLTSGKLKGDLPG